MKLPCPLEPGDTIGIFSPSLWSGENELSIRFLEGHGYKILPGSLYGKRRNYRSGTAIERAAELNLLIADPDVKCIMASRGGYVSNGILPYIDYEAFRRNPKIVVGMSDVTAVLFALFRETGIPVFYGPNLSKFSQVSPYSGDTFGAFQSIVSSFCQFPHALPHFGYWTDDRVNADELEVVCEKHESSLRTLFGGKTIGRLIAGNLNTIEGIMASKYMPEIKEGDILLIEDANRDAESIEREFQMLKICGIFDRISGLIIGKHADYKDCDTGKMNYEILLDVIGTPRCPILAEFDCSHTFPMVTVPIGVKVELDASQQMVTILESPFAQ